MKYLTTFTRIGRNHYIDPLEVTFGTDPDTVAYQVFQYAKKKLSSHQFEVEVNMDELKGTIEGGRFGSFTLEAVDD